MNLTAGAIPSVLTDKSTDVCIEKSSLTFSDKLSFRSPMKTKLYFLALVLLILSFGTAKGQDDFIALSSSQFIKGLENQDYLRKVLTDNGFKLVDKWKVKNFKGGLYEYWSYDSLVFVDMVLMRGQKADITVRIVAELPELPVRLLETFPFSKNEMRSTNLSSVNLARFNKDKAYSLRYAQEGKNIGVYVWYDDPYYFFVYSVGE
jgi:hypothetical protein